MNPTNIISIIVGVFILCIIGICIFQYLADNTKDKKFFEGLATLAVIALVFDMVIGFAIFGLALIIQGVRGY